MLRQLLSPQRNTLDNGKLVLIQDTTDAPDLSLFFSFIHHKVNSHSNVHVCLFEQPKQDFVTVIDATNVVVKEFFAPCYTKLHVDDFVATVCDIEQTSKHCVFIDSLNPWMQKSSALAVFQSLCKLKHCTHITEIVAVIHTDLLSPFTSLQLAKMADISLTLSKMPNVCLSEDVVHCNGRIVKSSKKVTLTEEIFAVLTDFSLQINICNLTNEVSSKMQESIPNKVACFETSRKQAEDIQKSLLVLPYKKTKQNGNILYEACSEDDLDYADPDEDLEF